MGFVCLGLDLTSRGTGGASGGGSGVGSGDSRPPIELAGMDAMHAGMHNKRSS